MCHLEIAKCKYMMPNEEFYKHPEKHLTIDDMGDLHLRWFNQHYAALRMLKNKPIFDKAFKILTERGNFSRSNAFGEMHPDGYLWIEKHDTIKVIVEEWQSSRRIYIDDGYNFHIRALEYKYNFPEYRVAMLKGITIDKFKKQGFKPFCPDINRFKGFTYGDERDDGYILSMYYLGSYYVECKYVNDMTLPVISRMESWEYYLDNLDELE